MFIPWTFLGGSWPSMFTEKHHDYANSRFGNVIVRLGYTQPVLHKRDYFVCSNELGYLPDPYADVIGIFKALSDTLSLLIESLLAL